MWSLVQACSKTYEQINLGVENVYKEKPKQRNRHSPLVLMGSVEPQRNSELCWHNHRGSKDERLEGKGRPGNHQARAAAKAFVLSGKGLGD